ncbi:MAG: hypothetical protein JKX73_11715 [Flavobacteriales bacterium]|nr:hypothetical protein [Flavobacteriales bacterium]
MTNTLRSLLLALFIIIFHFSSAQNRDIKRDIGDEYLKKILISEGTTAEAKFQNLAINLFLTGAKVDLSLFKNAKEAFVGVCLIADQDTIGRKNQFNIYSLRYKDLREEDFHKRIYSGSGIEGLACFYVKCFNKKEEKMLNKTIDQYLRKNSVPIRTAAYKFAKTHLVADKQYGRFFSSDGLSTVLLDRVGYSYIRRNGNCLIQIQGYPDLYLKDSSEETYGRDYFVNNWSVISIYIIDETTGATYNYDFK